MIVITERSQIRSLLTRFNLQYAGDHYHWVPLLRKQIEALDLDTCSKEDVAEILGNSLWTNLKCDECERQVDRVIQVGQEPDYESSTAFLCVDCVTKAHALITAKDAENDDFGDIPDSRGPSPSPPKLQSHKELE